MSRTLPRFPSAGFHRVPGWIIRTPASAPDVPAWAGRPFNSQPDGCSSTTSPQVVGGCQTVWLACVCLGSTCANQTRTSRLRYSPRRALGREPLDFDRDFDFPLPECWNTLMKRQPCYRALTVHLIFSRSTTPLRHLQDLTEFPHTLDNPGEPYSRTP